VVRFIKYSVATRPGLWQSASNPHVFLPAGLTLVQLAQPPKESGMSAVPAARDWTYRASACAFALLLLFSLLTF
jgi:hypothetical protein